MDPNPNSRRSVLTRIELIVLIVLVLVLAALAIPGFLHNHRDSNERGAAATLRTLGSAEGDFRANDRDWNRVNDFWTGDVKGLYTLTSAEVRGAGTAPKDPPIELIHVSVAQADSDPAHLPAAGENMPLKSFGPPAPQAGYWIAALITDLTMKGTPEAQLKQETGGTPAMGPVHNTSKFGFVAFPDSSSEGRSHFRINENNTVFREAVTGKGRTGTAVPPGLEAVPADWLTWPSGPETKQEGKWD